MCDPLPLGNVSYRAGFDSRCIGAIPLGLCPDGCRGGGVEGMGSGYPLNLSFSSDMRYVFYIPWSTCDANSGWAITCHCGHRKALLEILSFKKHYS